MQVLPSVDDARPDMRHPRMKTSRPEGYDTRSRKAEPKPAPVKPKFKKPKFFIKHRPDVYIPSSMTVANLANLLEVKLGMILQPHAKLALTCPERLQNRMKHVGMSAESHYDHSKLTRPVYPIAVNMSFYKVLTSDLASLLAEEFGRNPIVDDEAAFDVHARYESPCFPS